MTSQELIALNRGLCRFRPELGRQTFRRNPRRGFLLLQSRQVAGRPRCVPEADGQSGGDQESPGGGRQDPHPRRLRHHPCGDQLHHATASRPTGDIPIAGRRGREVAGCVGARVAIKRGQTTISWTARYSAGREVTAPDSSAAISALSPQTSAYWPSGRCCPSPASSPQPRARRPPCSCGPRIAVAIAGGTGAPVSDRPQSQLEAAAHPLGQQLRVGLRRGTKALHSFVRNIHQHAPGIAGVDHGAAEEIGGCAGHREKAGRDQAAGPRIRPRQWSVCARSVVAAHLFRNADELFHSFTSHPRNRAVPS